MATKMERVQTILNTLKDTPVTLAEARKVATAFGFTYRRGEVLTNTQEAGGCIAATKIVRPASHARRQRLAGGGRGSKGRRGNHYRRPGG